ncbi:MAG TPA: hypothetical protein VES20_08570 [Bryobacteraceae bacterium]|nr:hypothetical protein [Bryobacteraceae bacterium]
MKNTAFLVIIAGGLTQTGCVVVGGYSNTDGWFVWPGGFLIPIVILFLLVFFARRRRR